VFEVPLQGRKVNGRRLTIGADNLLELIGGGILVWGLYLAAGEVGAVITAAAVVLALAELSWTGKRWSVPLPRRPHLRFKIKTRLARRLHGRRSLVAEQLLHLPEPDLFPVPQAKPQQQEGDLVHVEI
jgi:hypothetical protein